jgi:hypothetical protein
VTRDLFSRLWLVGVAAFAVLMLLDLTGAYSPPSLVLVIAAGILLFLSSFVSRPWDAKREARRKAGR